MTKLPFAAVGGSTSGPSAADASWSVTLGGYTTAKSARQMPDGAVAVLVYDTPNGGPINGGVGLAKLSAATGESLWGPVREPASLGEGTSIDVDSEGNIALGGLSSSAGRYPQSECFVSRIVLNPPDARCARAERLRRCEHRRSTLTACERASACVYTVTRVAVALEPRSRVTCLVVGRSVG